jgi:hypothetical protein
MTVVFMALFDFVVWFPLPTHMCTGPVFATVYEMASRAVDSADNSISIMPGEKTRRIR